MGVKETARKRLLHEARRQVANERAVNRVGVRGQDVEQLADDKRVRRNYGSKTTSKMEGALASARREQPARHVEQSLRKEEARLRSESSKKRKG